MHLNSAGPPQRLKRLQPWAPRHRGPRGTLKMIFFFIKNFFSELLIKVKVGPEKVRMKGKRLTAVFIMSICNADGMIFLNKIISGISKRG